MARPSDHGFHKYTKGIVITFVLIVLVAGLIISFLDILKLQRIIRNLRYTDIIMAFVFVICSYAAVSGAYYTLFRAVEHRVPFGEFSRIIWISVTTNYLVASGGVGGTGLRALMLGKFGIPYMTTICISIMYFALSNLYLCLAAWQQDLADILAPALVLHIWECYVSCFCAGLERVL
jgi:uncharacterized membrane protein YbhN (UPF0104 family)